MAVLRVMVRMRVVMGSVPVMVVMMLVRVVMGMPSSDLCAHGQAKLAQVAVHLGLALQGFLLQLLQAVQHRIHKAQFRQHQPVDFRLSLSLFLHCRLDFFTNTPVNRK